VRRTVKGTIKETAERTRRTRKPAPKRAREPAPLRAPPPLGALMRIAAVAAETGVPEPTLRAWERRYGIPTPTRTAAGYRLYGAEHVEQVRRMRELCDAGVAAAEAARLVLGPPAPQAAAHMGFAPGADAMGRAVASLLGHIERFDEVGLADEARRLFGLADSITLLDRVIRPVLLEVGDRWHRGTLSVAHEHLATHALRELLSDLVRLTPTPSGAPRVVLACFEDEQHELGLLGVALRVASWGIRPVTLGARTPPSALRSALHDTHAAQRPALALLSVSIAPERARVRSLLHEYAKACGDTPWIVGGAAAPALASQVESCGGHVEPADPNQLHALVQRLIHQRHSSRA
jgi:MerR family transcriptional regulator, light-induced transcriptional regulator